MYRIEAQLKWEKIEEQLVNNHLGALKLHLPVRGQTFAYEPYVPKSKSPHMYGNDNGNPADIKASDYELRRAINATQHLAGSGERCCKVCISFQSSLSSHHWLTNEHAFTLIKYINSGNYRAPLKPHINDN